MSPFGKYVTSRWSHQAHVFCIHTNIISQGVWTVIYYIIGKLGEGICQSLLALQNLTLWTLTLTSYD